MSRRREPIRHGTNGGYRTHFRHGEPMCEPCRDANRKAKGYKSARKLSPCGTQSAYRRHLRRGETVDAACRKANADACRPYRQAAYARAKADSSSPRRHSATSSEDPR